MIKIKALDDGNCAFNAFALVGLNAIVLGRLDCQATDNKATRNEKQRAQTAWLNILTKAGIINDDADWSLLKDRLSNDYGTHQKQCELQKNFQQKLRDRAVQINLEQINQYLINTTEVFVAAYEAFLNNDNSDDIYSRCPEIRKIFLEKVKELNSLSEKCIEEFNIHDPQSIKEIRDDILKKQKQQLKESWKSTYAKLFIEYTKQDKVWVGDLELAPLAKLFGLSLFIQSTRFGKEPRHIYSYHGELKDHEQLTNELLVQLVVKNIVYRHPNKNRIFLFHDISLGMIKFQIKDVQKSDQDRIIELYERNYVNPVKIILCNKNATHWDCWTENPTWLKNKEPVVSEKNKQDVSLSHPILQGEEPAPGTGLRNSLHGNVFQLKLLMWFIRVGLKNEYQFKLATELDAAEKFDDVVFKRKSNDGSFEFRLLQAKHRQHDKAFISESDLLNITKGDFSLKKYFLSYLAIKRKINSGESPFENGTLKDLILYTNINLNSAKQPDLSLALIDSFEEIKTKDPMFHDSGKRYQLKPEMTPFKEELIVLFKECTELVQLAKQCLELVLHEKSFTLKSPILAKYRFALSLYVLEVKDINTVRIKPSFFNEIDQDTPKGRLSEEFLKQYAALFKKMAFSKDASEQYKNELLQVDIKTSKNFAVQLSDNPIIDDPEGLAKQIAEDISNVSDDGTATVNVNRRKQIYKKNIDKLALYVIVGSEEKDIYQLSGRFIQGKELPPSIATFRKHLIHALQQNKLTLDEISSCKLKINDYQTCHEKEFPACLALPNDNITDQDIKEFTQHFVFAVGQQNEERLGERLQKEIGDEFKLLDPIIYERFHIAVLDWMKQKHGTFLDETECQQFFVKVRHKLSQLFLVGPTHEFKKRMEAYKLEFKSEATSALFSGFKKLLDNEKLLLLHLIAPLSVWFASIKLYQVLSKLKKYRNHDSYVFLEVESAVRLKELILQALQSEKRNLIILQCEFFNNDFETFWTELLTIINDRTNKKFILISKEISPLPALSKDDERYETVTDEQHGFDALTPQTQHNILQREVNLQGDDQFTLQDFISVENISDFIAPKNLYDLISATTLVIGDDFSMTIPTLEKFYIPRVLRREIQLSMDWMKNITAKEAFYLTGLLSVEAKKKFPGIPVINFEEVIRIKLKHIASYIILGKDKLGFQQLTKRYPAETLHWVHCTNNKYIWRRSTHDIRGIQRLLLLETFIETEESNQHDKYNQTQVLAAEPGMGKSRFISQAANFYKRAYPTSWVILINLAVKPISAIQDEFSLAEKLRMLFGISALNRIFPVALFDLTIFFRNNKIILDF